MASNFLDQWKQSGRKINHSGFDVSGKRAFSTPAGLMTCPFFMETNPNEHFELDVQGLLRTETLNTAAFVSGKQLTSMFFVPYSQIWHNYNSFVTQKDDRHSATQKSMSYLPCISLRELYWLYFSFYITYRWVKIRIGGKEPTPDNYPSSTADSNNFASTFDPLHLAYAPKFSFAFDMHGIPYVHTLGRAIQYFRLGTPYVISAMVDKLFNDNYTPDDDPDADTAAQFAALVSAASQTIVATFQDSDWFADKYVNIMRPAAYQHIFYDYYRNKYFDEEPYYQNTTGTSIRYVDVYNYDDLECSSVANSALTVSHVRIPHAPENFYQARIMNLFDLHYRQYKHDIFTSAMNSTQFGAVSSISFNGTGNINFDSGASGLIQVMSDGSIRKLKIEESNAITSLTNSSLDYVSYFGDYTDGTSAVFGDNVEADSTSVTTGPGTSKSFIHPAGVGSLSSSFNIPSLFDVLQLRRAELLQQWKMNALRAGNMVYDNFRQHYGVEPYYEADNNVRLVGSWECDLNVNPVTATSSTGQDVNGNVGDLAAIGVGSVNGHKVRLKCNDFGVIVAISYFLPDVYYSANGIDESNIKLEPFDFYSEEFENCGFEPLPLYNQSIGNFANNSNNLGFVPPYTLYKTNTDVVFGEFGELSAIGATGVDDFTYQGSLRAWTMQRSDVPTTLVNGVLVRDKSAFYIDPKVTNPIFALYYNGNQNTDPLHCFYNFDVKALRPMSVLGLPIFS